MNTRFTIEEENIVAIYAEDSRETTLENILAAMPYMDEDMRQLAAAAVNKLQAMTDSEFSECRFRWRSFSADYKNKEGAVCGLSILR